jgi:hypothetical protein
MRKLQLDPEALAVETFDTTSAVDAARGTVRGRSLGTYESDCPTRLWTYESGCLTRQCTPEGTCDTTCDPNRACGCRYSHNVTCDVNLC